MSVGSGEPGPEIWHSASEPLVTFLLPLPEALAIPVGRPMAELRKVDFRLHHILEGLTHEGDSPGPGDGGKAPEAGKRLNLVRAHVQTASAVIHRVDVDLVAQVGLDAALEAALRAQPRKDRLGIAQDLAASDAPDTGGAVRSVAEVCIPLQVLVACQAADAGETGGVALPERDDIDEELLTRAFDRAVEYVRTIQSAYHAMTRRPVTLLANELLPPFVPYLVRSAQQIQDEEVVPVDLFFVHMSIGHLVEEPDITDDQFDGMFNAAERSEILLTYLDLHRHGSVAFHRHGNTREAVVMMAAAAESLLDIVLGLLLWEEGLTPERASQLWAEGLMTRVRTSYSARLGGRWDVTSTSPVGEWSRSVAGVRHRVVHAGYMPTRLEAERAIAAVESLLSFIGDRLVYGSNLRTYPRSASQLLGVYGLRRRQRFPRWLEQLQQDPEEPIWHATFGRWYLTFTRVLGDATTPRQSTEVGATVFAVVDPNGRDNQTTWIISDGATRQAAEAEVDLAASLGDPVERSLSVDWGHGVRLDSRISIGIHPDGVRSVRRTGPWVEEYHLLPLNGVMVDGSDFESPWPISVERS